MPDPPLHHDGRPDTPAETAAALPPVDALSLDVADAPTTPSRERRGTPPRRRQDRRQADRLRLLATVTSLGDGTFEERVARALRLTSELLGLDIGILSEIEGDTYTVLACHAPPGALAPGDTFEVGQTYCAITLAHSDVLAIDHMGESEHHRHPCYEAFGLESYIGAPVLADGAAVGTLNFSASAPRSRHFDDADRDLVRLLAMWVSAQLEARDHIERLREREAHLGAVMDAAPVILYAFDRDGTVTLSEGQGLGTLGLEPGEAVGSSVYAWSDDPEVQAHTRGVLEGEAAAWTSHHHGVHFQTRVRPSRDAHGRITGGVAVSVDVTQQVEAERAVAAQTDRLRTLLAAVSREGLLDDLPFEAQAEAVLAQMTELLGLDVGLLAQIEGGTYTCLAASSRGGETLRPGDALPLADTYCDLTLLEGDLIAIEHMGASPYRRHRCYTALGLEAYIGIPLVVGGETFGALSFSSREPAPRPLTDFDKDLVRLAAQWAEGLLERHRHAQAMAESERRFRLLSHATSEGIALTDEGRIFLANDQFAQLYGHTSADELIGTSPVGLVAPEFRETVAQAIRENSTEVFEIAALRTDGSRFWVEAQGRPIPYEGRTVRMTAIRDITERKRAEAETRFQADVLGHVSDAVVALDLDGRVTYWNAGAAALHGIAEADALGQRLDALVRYAIVRADDEAHPVGAVEDALRSEAASEGALLFRRDDGSRRFVQVASSTLRDDAGQPRGLLAVMRDVTPQRALAHRLRHQATHDALTGLPNRAHFRERLGAALAEGHPFAVLFVDLDRFKTVNDSLGHDAGDRLLETVAHRLRETLGASEGATVARLGGDEFAALLPGVDDAQARESAEGLLRALAAPIALGPRDVDPSASVGLVPDGRPYDSPEALLRDADTAMYVAKREGRGRVIPFDPAMHAEVAHRFGLEGDLRHAVARGQLRVVYQPVVSLDSLAVTGVEALVRWRHPRHGLVAPDVFIPIAEDLGLVAEIDRWVLRTALADVATWSFPAGTPADLHVAVNCAAQTFLGAGLGQEATALARDAGVDPGRLVMELTERALVDTEAAPRALQALREAGIRLAVDDFGTGYSSLGLLHALAVDGLKIDRSFVSDLPTSRASRAIVSAILRLGADLGVGLVAEGIETQAQADALRDLGCTHGQGYLFSPPVSPDEARRLILSPPWAA